MHIEYSFCECKRLCTESKILGTVGLEAAVHLYELYLFIFPPVASAPTTLMAVQEGHTGIRVSWTPTTSLGGTGGYRIYYSGGSNGSVNVSDGSIDSYLVGSLQNGANYTICIVGTSKHFFSEEVKKPNNITLSELLILVVSTWSIGISTFSSDPAPSQPSVTVISSTATTISLSWSVPSGSVVESYEVKWERNDSNNSTTITDGSTSYTIRGLEAEANYTITARASNGAGSAVSDPVTGTTGRAGSMMCVKVFT